MTQKIVLVTGGARSGKSTYAETRALALGARRLYLATGEAKDAEMAERIAQHQKRRGPGWDTVEEPLEVGRVLWDYQGKVDCVLLDCLTLWISNLLIQRGEARARSAVMELVQDLSHWNFHLLVVTNEVGWGIVPDNPLARQFRDLTGWANQRMAEAASEAVLMVAGIPCPLKK